ncbi:MAG: histidine phosphatase family protein [Novosphingobium sp. 28-62-57]|uniref:SixA phosphatase family protein n=1 Tax=unclassified Novosphingobium TaxID=2644732 RepID=UPI000BC9ED06|nr:MULTISPECIES: histidine phosphatase family protein [unclassified Novosphingobium]OYW50036.1 MAG: histidine phosphatase family protein [Novosphingobium sp. 12-62-10]OYZ12190.1 MAG: histidine phosphatase family protein [Novosphingobium sp. 28-62-57]OZA36075.1 MAG: histidine phosphatase family protein [Novosphingobium sp. 17-62-9]HQS70169.1 histidine phosphatase family protein [Novosphingobium sp.]
MKTLALFRHAKSDWSDARARDFDRPLNARGQRGAQAMGAYIKNTGRTFDRMIASPAVRAAETVEEASKAWKCTFKVEWDRRIYLASSATLIDLLKELSGDPASVLMVGHNPGLEDLIFDLVPDDGSSPLRAVVEEKFPTATFAVLELDVDSWSDVAEGCARLVEIKRPRDLDPTLGPQLID